MKSNITLKVSDGTEMSAYVARASISGGQKAPGILVLQEAFGVNAHIRDMADRLAREGYNAIAPELFHRSAPRGWEGSYDNFEAIKPHFSEVTPERLTADIQTAADWLEQDSQTDGNRLGSIGFCLGGRSTFLANSFLPLKAAVSFYGGGIAPAMLPLAEKQHGPILLFWGGLDAHIGHEQPRAVADALRAAKKTYSDVMFSYADHGFLCSDRQSYNATATRHALSLTYAFLKTHLQGE